MQALKLRPYQERALDDLWQWFLAHDDGNPIVKACVGAGKSLMIAATSRRAHEEYPGTRTLVLVHQHELLGQNVEKLVRYWPGANIGLYSAGSGRKDLGTQVTVATIGSIWKDAYKLGRIDIVHADECHLINPKEEGMWRSFLADLAKTCPHARTIGWTGSDYRGNGVFLTAGKEPLFTHVGAEVKMRELLDLGFLAPLVPGETIMRVSSDGFRTTGEDYNLKDMAHELDRADIVNATCDDIVEKAAGRKRWLGFAVNIEHAGHVRDALLARGIPTGLVSSKTPKGERGALIAAFKAGRLRCLVNVGVLTTGFDVPAVDCIFLLRSTKSPVLYVQIAGRGMRVLGADIHESIRNGKADCLWLDYTDTTLRLGPVDLIKGRLPSTAGKGEAPIKLCPECGSRNPAAAPFCTSCGFQFPEPERIKHKATASDAAVLSTQLSNPDEHRVTDVKYHVHRKPGMPDSMRVEYWTGPRLIAKEWVLFDHEGYTRLKAESWWTRRAAFGGIPSTTADAVVAANQGALRVPASIVTAKNGKYAEITSYNWETQPA